MIRKGGLKVLRLATLLLPLIATGPVPAWAEAPLDWYIELKREAKYARIAAQRGASPSDLRPYAEAAARLADRIGAWDKPPVRASAKTSCLSAVNAFQRALNAPTSEGRVTGIIGGEVLRDACVNDIWGR